MFLPDGTNFRKLGLGVFKDSICIKLASLLRSGTIFVKKVPFLFFIILYKIISF